MTLKIDILFSAEESNIDDVRDEIVSAVDKYFNYAFRCLRVAGPCKNTEKNTTNYKLLLTVENVNKASSKELFDIINSVYPIKYVTVVDERFYDNSNNEKFWWTNEGETTYHDGGTYVDPYYKFHEGSDIQNYEIVYIPVYSSRFAPREKTYYEQQGSKFMWKCVSCWDNWLKGETIEEAIEEFEQMYKKKLWNSIESIKQSLNNACDKFSDFDEYRWSKRW